MKILLIYANRYFLESPIYPFGLNLIADYLENQGHEVHIDIPFIHHRDISKGMEIILKDFKPDIAGISIRNIDTAMACEKFGTWQRPGINTHFFLPDAEETVAAIKKQLPEIPVIAGGSGFSVSPKAIMKQIKADFGITGDGAGTMANFIQSFQETEKLEQIPNLLMRKKDGQIKENKKAFCTDLNINPIKRDKSFDHCFTINGMPVQIKHGCSMDCSYCVEPFITKKKIVHRKKENIIQELEAVAEKYPDLSEIFFVDTEFNIPTPDFSLALLKDIIKSKLNQRFRFSSQFLPLNFTKEYAELIFEAGFYVILTCDSFSDKILKKNNCPYREKDIKKTLSFFEKQ
ncbi:MAG: cobalamin-dependent protein, partial [Thermodesulfobacteriota bacterium]|nr:cobalamin-dependent protein [Thermodesulfobacteriota bacterium]